VKNLERRRNAADADIGEILAGADFAGDAGNEARTAPTDGGELDIGIFFFK